MFSRYYFRKIKLKYLFSKKYLENKKNKRR